MNGKLDALKHEEQEAWVMMRDSIDFTDKSKKRVYQKKRPYSPLPIEEVEADFVKTVYRWLAAREILLKVTSQGYNATRPEADANPGPQPQP